MPTQLMSTGRSAEFLDPTALVGIPHNVYAETTLPDTTPVNPSLIYDGTTVSEISIPSGKFVITDLLIGFGFVYWTIQLDTGDGGGFRTLATFGFTLIGSTTEIKAFKTPITIQGGAGVKIRLQAQLATTPTVAIDVNATLRCYTDGSLPRFPTRTPSVFTLTDLATSGSTEQVMNVAENGGTPGLSIPVPTSTVLQITDFDVASGSSAALVKLQYTSDGGVNWFTMGALEVAGLGTATWAKASPTIPWVITGGASVLVQITATTPAGVIPVTGVILGARLS
jgi:hypothetical protein